MQNCPFLGWAIGVYGSCKFRESLSLYLHPQGLLTALSSASYTRLSTRGQRAPQCSDGLHERILFFVFNLA